VTNIKVHGLILKKMVKVHTWRQMIGPRGIPLVFFLTETLQKDQSQNFYKV